MSCAHISELAACIFQSVPFFTDRCEKENIQHVSFIYKAFINVVNKVWKYINSE